MLDVRSSRENSDLKTERLVAATLEDVIGTFQLADPHDATRIPADKIIGWMAEDDIEVMGAVLHYTAYEDSRSRIDPPLRFESSVDRQ